MGVKCAFRVSGRARRVNDDRRIVRTGRDGRKILRSVLDRLPERFRAGMNRAAGDIDVLQMRQTIADLRQLVPAALVGDDGLGAAVGKPELQRVLAEQREQRHRDQAGAERRQMCDRQLHRLREEHADAVAAHETIGLQRIGEAARQ